MTKAKKRVILRINLTQQTRGQIVDLSNDMGVTQVHLASRLVEWFTEQPNKIQLGILGISESNDAEIVKQLLQQIAGRK